MFFLSLGGVESLLLHFRERSFWEGLRLSKDLLAAGGGQHPQLEPADGSTDANPGHPACAADGGRQSAAVRQEDRQGRE